MGLSNEIIQQFVKATNDKKTTTKTETRVYGTVVYNGKPYVKIDGSELLTPVQTATDVKDGDRVIVSIKNHTATITGNLTDPSASSTRVIEYGEKIEEFNTVIAYQITTEDLDAVHATIDNLEAIVANIGTLEAGSITALLADIENLRADYAELDKVTAKDMEVINAEIDMLVSRIAEIKDLTVEDLTAVNAEVDHLKAYNAKFTYVSADVLAAIKAEIDELEANQITVKDLDAKYANIDFSNIGEAAIEYLYATSGLIKDVVISNGTITGEIVGVTIRGDLIEGGTVKADKLVLRGEDGIYYKLNASVDGVTKEDLTTEEYQSGFHGELIISHTITAEKLLVDDLVAFDATIGGFNITESTIYSRVKNSVDNPTPGLYMDKDGQLAFGNNNEYIKYYRQADGTWKLDISAANIVMSSSGKTIEKVVDDLENNITKNDIGGRNLIRNSIDMLFEDYRFGESILPADIYATYDEFGNVELHGRTLRVTYDADGNVYVTY